MVPLSLCGGLLILCTVDVHFGVTGAIVLAVLWVALCRVSLRLLGCVGQEN